MKTETKISVRLLSTGMLILVFLFGLFAVVHTEPITASNTINLSNGTAIQDPQTPLASDDPMIEEAPEGYLFPYEDGTGSTPDEPLPDPGLLITQGPSQFPELKNSNPKYVKVSTQLNNRVFDLGTWLLRAYAVLDSIFDPVALHQIGQRILAFQRGPLVDDLGLKFLEKASAQDPSLGWTANNYAVQRFLIEGISPKTQSLFEEASIRALRSGEDSYASLNMQIYQAFTERVESRISSALSRYSVGNLGIEDHLSLINDLIVSNYIDQGETHLGRITSNPEATIPKQILQGLLLKKKKDFKGAASAFQAAASFLERESQDQAESVRILRRLSAILEENAMAASTGNRRIAKSGRHIRFVSLVSNKTRLKMLYRTSRHLPSKTSTTAPVFVAQVTVRARLICPYLLWISNVRFYGFFQDFPLANRYNETKTVPAIFYKTVATDRASANSPKWWSHCAHHPDFVAPAGTICALRLHPARKNVRISWTILCI